MRIKATLYLTLIALTVRFLYFFQSVDSPFFGRPILDQHYYDLCARQLAGGGGELIDGFRPLLYPIFLSVFYIIDLDGGLLAALIAQLLLGVASSILVAFLSARLFNSARAGMISGLCFVLSAPPLFYEVQLLITTFCSFLLIVLWAAVLRAVEKRSIKSEIFLWLVSGLTLGLASQARPNALALLIFFPLLSLYRLFFHQKKRSIRSAALPLLALAGLLLVQIAFAALQARFSGHFDLITHAGGINLYLGNSREADGMIPKQDRHVVQGRIYKDPIQLMAAEGYREETGNAGPITEQQVSKYWKNRTLTEIKHAPGRWLHLMLKKTWLMFWNHEVPNNRSFSFAAQKETPLLKWLPVRWWLLLALCPWGIAALVKHCKYEQLLWILSFFIVYSGTIIVFFVNSRFRIPLWPGMAILSGGGVLYLLHSLRNKRPLILPLSFSILFSALSLINWFDIPPDNTENDLFARSRAYLERGHPERALPDIDQCLEKYPGNPRYHFLKGNILQQMGEYPLAISFYLRAIQLSPNDPSFHNNLGVAFEHAGDTESAEKAYLHALRLQPDLPSALRNLELLRDSAPGIPQK